MPLKPAVRPLRPRSNPRTTPLPTAICILLLAVLLLAHQPLPGYAAPTGREWRPASGVHGAEHFVGQYRNNEGETAYCTDFERLSPAHAGAYDGGHHGGFIRSDGTRLTERENAGLSYLLHRWGGTSDNATAASVQLAVWALTSPGMAWGSSGMDRILQAEKLPAAVIQQAQVMTSAALTNAGPYEVHIDLAETGDGLYTAGVSVRGTDGNPVDGLTAEARVTGPFGLAGNSPDSWTTGEAVEQLTLERTGLGAGTLEVAIPRTPAAEVEWLIPSRTDAQRLLVAAVLDRRDASAALADLPAFQPVVATRTSAARTEAGSEVHDVLTVSSAEPTDGSEPIPWLVIPGSQEPVSVEVVSTLWGPLAAPPTLRDAVPHGTPQVGTVTTRVNGPGTYNTDALEVPTPGWYVWTETIPSESALPAEAAKYVRTWQSRFGITEETTFVPWRPSITTRLSAHEAFVGESVTDSVTVDGLGPEETFDGKEAARQIRLSMYGPLPERPVLQSAIPPGARLHSETMVPASNGHHVSKHFAPFTEPGCYTVVASFAGDSHTDPLTTPFGEQSETICVDSAPAPAASSPAAEPSEPQKVGNQGPAAGREQLAQTGVRTEVAAGAGLLLLGTGLACLQRRIRSSGRSPS
ncbi:hypothetical protein GC088_05685 [Arthrobacter sp. JZ12]|uniref:hypothetical protein n=1 Tax=Arthrobacter sp. JZ12 TaxID=2654190 RepID=UPI002B47E3DD|nr:hypothetical protein [Arthrobacter sp. JZ12]WRH24611.1 hypothetical protein GC088_05685 [Arthrobacter sp. JZ12]